MKIEVDNNLSPNELANKFRHLVDERKYTFEQQCSLIINLGKKFKINFTNEQLIFIVSSSSNILCDACPGSGKTTAAMFSLFHRYYVHKIRMDKCLVIVYTRQARNDFESRFKNIQATLNNTSSQELHIPESPNICTMHSLAKEWVTEYCYELGYTRDQIKSALIDNVDDIFMQLLTEKFNSTFELLSNYDVRSLIQYYTYTKESNIDLYKQSENDLKNNRYYPKNVPLPIVREVYEEYETYKLVNLKVDFTDLLTKFYELIKTNEGVLNRLKSNYHYIVADEFQDATMLFINIFQLLASHDNFKAMGDTDQCLYNFRGVEKNNMLDFGNTFPNSIICTLTYNMRCPKPIIELSNNIISNNTERYEKLMYGKKEECELDIIPFYNKKKYIEDIIKKIRTIPPNEHGSIGILYRNSRVSAYIATYLSLCTEIKYTVHSGTKLFGDILSKSILYVYNWAVVPNKEFLKQLYRYTPLNKEESLALYKRYDTVEECMTGISNLAILSTLQDLIDFKTCCEKYEPSTSSNNIINNIFLYYLNYIGKLMISKGESIDTELYNLVKGFFVDHNYTVQQILSKVVELTKVEDSRFSVNLSTIHSSKGTEYKYVILPDVDETFPNMYNIGELTKEEISSYLEEEVRVLYVGITRTKYSLTIFLGNSVFTDLFKKKNLVEDAKESSLATEERNDEVEDLFAEVETEDCYDTKMIELPPVYSKLLAGYKKGGAL